MNTTPLGLIFRENPRLSGEVKILEIATKGQNAYFAVGDVARPNAGKVVLHFIQTSPQWTFYGWGFIGRDTNSTPQMRQWLNCPTSNRANRPL